jgi:hypothetical protein
MAQQGILHSSSQETDTTGVGETSTGNDSAGDTGDTEMADAVLVAHSTTTKGFRIRLSALRNEIEKLGLGRMSFIKQCQEKRGISSEGSKYLKGKNRSSTSKKYEHAWLDWVAFCLKHNFKPLDYDMNNIFSMFLDIKNSSLSIPKIYQDGHCLYSSMGSND